MCVCVRRKPTKDDLVSILFTLYAVSDQTTQSRVIKPDTGLSRALCLLWHVSTHAC